MSTLETATVGDVMHVGVLSCPADAPLTEVARIMADHHVHAVIVNGLGSDRWGVVSDLDLVGRFDAHDVQTATAGTMSATPAVVVAPADPLWEATRVMHDYDVHHLLVVDPANRRPIGVLSTSDVAAVIAGRVPGGGP